MKTVLLAALAIAAGTWIGAPTLAPIVVGAVVGLAWPYRAARHAALAGIAAWGGLLVLAILRGDDIGTLGMSLGSAMGLPGWALFVATLLYPALLASSAAWLGHVITPRQFFFSSTSTYPPRHRRHS